MVAILIVIIMARFKYLAWYLCYSSWLPQWTNSYKNVQVCVVTQITMLAYYSLPFLRRIFDTSQQLLPCRHTFNPTLMSTNFLNLQSRVFNINARVFIVQLKQCKTRCGQRQRKQPVKRFIPGTSVLDAKQRYPVAITSRAPGLSICHFTQMSRFIFDFFSSSVVVVFIKSPISIAPMCSDHVL